LTKIHSIANAQKCVWESHTVGGRERVREIEIYVGVVESARLVITEEHGEASAREEYGF